MKVKTFYIKRYIDFLRNVLKLDFASHNISLKEISKVNIELFFDENINNIDFLKDIQYEKTVEKVNNSLKISYDINLMGLVTFRSDYLDTKSNFIFTSDHKSIKTVEHEEFYELWLKNPNNDLFKKLMDDNLKFVYNKHSDNLTKVKIYKFNLI